MTAPAKGEQVAGVRVPTRPHNKGLQLARARGAGEYSLVGWAAQGALVKVGPLQLKPSVGRTPGGAMDQRSQLIEKIRRQGLPSPDGTTALPVVSLEDFFTGNDDLGSIGCNLVEHPGPERFFQVLRQVRARPEVKDILVEICEVEESDPSMWPFSERVYVITTAPQREVAEWLSELQPDAVEEGYASVRPAVAPDVEAPYRIWGVWWD